MVRCQMPSNEHRQRRRNCSIMFAGLANSKHMRHTSFIFPARKLELVAYLSITSQSYTYCFGAGDTEHCCSAPAVRTGCLVISFDVASGNRACSSEEMCKAALVEAREWAQEQGLLEGAEDLLTVQ
eukprot:scaffold115146_cov28-Tisochrysis_lutea.AAC.1